MSDNVPITAGSGTNIATRAVTYSGDAAQVQVVGLAAFSGSDDAKSVADLPGDATNGLRVSPAAAYTTSATLQNAVSASGNGTDFDVTGMATVAFTVSGTFTATVAWKGSADGSNFFPLRASTLDGSGVTGTSTTATGIYVANVAGLTKVRAVVTWTSGTTVTVAGSASPFPSPTAIDSNSGNASAGTQRVVIATDQPNFTNNVPVQVRSTGSASGTLQLAVSASGNGSTLNVLGYGTVVFTVSGTFVATVIFEGSEDSANWSTLNAVQLGTSTVVTSATAPGLFQVNCAGLNFVRARVVWTSGTSVTVVGHAVPLAWPSHIVALGAALPAGSNVVGGVTVGAGATNIAKAEDVASADADVGVPAMAVRKATPANTSGTDGDYEMLQVSNGRLWADCHVDGEAAHGASTAGNPILNGAEAIAHGTNPTAVSAGQATKAYANRAGVPFVIGGHPNIQTVRLQFTAAQTDVAIITVGAGSKIVVTSFQVTLDNASTVFPSVRIGFGTASTPTTTGVIGAHGGVPAGGGFGRGDGSGIIGVGADNEDLRITTVGAATGNGVEVVVSYFTIES